MKGLIKIIAIAIIGIASFAGYLSIFGSMVGIKPAQTFSLLISSKAPINKNLDGMATADSSTAKSDSALATTDSTRMDSTSTGNMTGPIPDSLKQQGVDISKEKAELEKLKGEVKELLSNKARSDSQQVKNLAKIYDGIEAQQLAAVLANMDDSLVIAIIPCMKTLKAGKILESMPPDRAARISSKLLGMK
jgi:flagellar motility protein MotE (MotC chaperone)